MPRLAVWELTIVRCENRSRLCETVHTRPPPERMVWSVEWALDVDDSEGVLTAPQRRLALEAAQAVFSRHHTDPIEAALAVLARHEVLAGSPDFEWETAAVAMVWLEAAALVQEICGQGAYLYLRQERMQAP